MAPALNPLRPTETVLSWLLENREGVLIGALVAAIMLIARMVGQRMIARES